MTKATTAATTKRDNRDRCKRCDKKFTPKRSNQKYCNSQCRVSSNSTKRSSAKKPYEVPLDAPFCKWLIRECRRAGHAQIMSGHTEQSLMDLYKLHAFTSKVNMYRTVSDNSGYHKSHIVPVQGSRVMGLLHAENLVVSTAADNKRHGVNHYGYGKGIERRMLNPSWAVPQWGMTNETVFGLILEVVGREKFERFARKAKLTPSQRTAHIEFLTTVLRDDNPEHQEHLKALRSSDTKTHVLGAIVATLKGNKVSTFKMDCDHFTAFRVFKEESLRMSNYRPELAELHRMLQKIELAEHSRTLEEPKLKAWESAAIFDILHGRELSDFEEVLSDMQERHVKWSKELILKYDPAAFTFGLFDGVMDQKPEMIPKRIGMFTSFVDELDDRIENLVPVLMRSQFVCDSVEAPF